ncbi:MAG: hypothetical protein SOV02_08965 [Streptococcus infantarius]|nr:hypothetical protein [Streptococcus infantarius]
MFDPRMHDIKFLNQMNLEEQVEYSAIKSAAERLDERLTHAEYPQELLDEFAIRRAGMDEIFQNFYDILVRKYGDEE